MKPRFQTRGGEELRRHKTSEQVRLMKGVDVIGSDTYKTMTPLFLLVMFAWVVLGQQSNALSTAPEGLDSRDKAVLNNDAGVTGTNHVSNTLITLTQTTLTQTAVAAPDFSATNWVNADFATPMETANPYFTALKAGDAIGSAPSLKFPGYQFEKWLAAELEPGFIHNEVKNGGSDIEQTRVLATLVARDRIGASKFSYQIGAGPGGDLITVGIPGPVASQSTIAFAYQGTAGVQYDLSDKASLGLGYKYFSTISPSIGDGGAKTDADFINAQSVLLSIKLKF